MSDAFTRGKLDWLEALAADPAVTHFQVRVAALLVTRYLNRLSGDAYPSQERLAAETGATPDGVRKALKHLAALGHLQVKQGGGRGVNSRYRPVHGAPKGQIAVEGFAEKPQTAICETPDPSPENPRPAQVLTLRGEPSEEPIERAPRKKARRPLPDGFPDQRARMLMAQRFREAGLALDVHAEVERFRDHHLAQGSVFADWEAALRKWTGNAIRFAQERGDQFSRSQANLRRSLAGSQRATRWSAVDQSLAMLDEGTDQ